MPSLTPVREHGPAPAPRPIIALRRYLTPVREAGGRAGWITLHAEDSDEGTVHVYVGSNGYVEKGPASLCHHHIGALSAHPSVKRAERHPDGHEPAGARQHPTFTEKGPKESGANAAQDTPKSKGKPYARLHGADQGKAADKPARIVGDGERAKDYVTGYLSQYKKGKPGFSDGQSYGGGKRQEVVYRDESGKTIGVMAIEGSALTDIAVHPKSQGQGVGSKMAEEAMRRGVTTVKGPYSSGGAAIANKIHDAVYAKAQGNADRDSRKTQIGEAIQKARDEAKAANDPATKLADAAVAHQQAQTALAQHRARADKYANPYAPHLSPPVDDATDRQLAEQATRAEVAHQAAQQTYATPKPAASKVTAEKPKAEPEEHHATLTRDRQTGRAWLDFGGKPTDEQIAALKKEGWRYSGYRQQWHNPRKYVTAPAGITAKDGGTNEYSAERAERNENTAGKVRAEAQGHLDRAHQIGSMIPMGQPILVGHHSEGRHRRDLDRIDTAMGKGVEGMRAADDLERRASSGGSAKALGENPGVIARRIDRLETDKRRMTQGVNRWPEGPQRDARLKQVQDEIDQHKARLDELGGVPGASLDYKPGDIVRSKGGLHRVERIGPKNVALTSLGPSGFVLSHDKSHIKEVVKRAEDLSHEEHAAITAHIPFETERKKAYNPTAAPKPAKARAPGVADRIMAQNAAGNEANTAARRTATAPRYATPAPTEGGIQSDRARAVGQHDLFGGTHALPEQQDRRTEGQRQAQAGQMSMLKPGMGGQEQASRPDESARPSIDVVRPDEDIPVGQLRHSTTRFPGSKIVNRHSSVQVGHDIGVHYNVTAHRSSEDGKPVGAHEPAWMVTSDHDGYRIHHAGLTRNDAIAHAKTLLHGTPKDVLSPEGWAHWQQMRRTH